MIARAFSLPATYESIANEINTIPRAPGGRVSIQSIMEASVRLGLCPLCGSISIEKLFEEMTRRFCPCILFRLPGHYIVLCEIFDDRLLIADPVIGLYSIRKRGLPQYFLCEQEGLLGEVILLGFLRPEGPPLSVCSRSYSSGATPLQST